MAVADKKSYSVCDKTSLHMHTASMLANPKANIT